MMGQLATWNRCVLAGALSVWLVACGGDVVGIGNDGTRVIEGCALEEVAEALAANAATPHVTDEVLTSIFSAILERATQGDPEAALIVLRVAEEQRQEGER